MHIFVSFSPSRIHIYIDIYKNLFHTTHMKLKKFKTTIFAQHYFNQSEKVEHTFTVEAFTKNAAELDAMWLFWDKVDSVDFNFTHQETEEVD